MKKIRYEEYVVRNRYKKYSLSSYYEWKYEFLKHQLYNDYGYNLFMRYMHHDISIKWDMKR